MVSFSAEPIISLGFLHITNAFLGTLFVDIILILTIYFLNKNLSLIPNFFQNILEMLIDGFYTLTESVAGINAPKIFPFFATFFIFILLANWSGLIPGVTSVGFYEKGKLIPIIRSATTDFNVTFGLALVSAISTHILSVKTVGIKDYFVRVNFT